HRNFQRGNVVLKMNLKSISAPIPSTSRSHIGSYFGQQWINIETDVHAGSIEGRARAGNMETAPRCRPNGLRFSCGRAAAQPCDYAAPLAARPSPASACGTESAARID